MRSHVSTLCETILEDCHDLGIDVDIDNVAWFPSSGSSFSKFSGHGLLASLLYSAWRVGLNKISFTSISSGWLSVPCAGSRPQ
jgi:hypothetical protein